MFQNINQNINFIIFYITADFIDIIVKFYKILT